MSESGVHRELSLPNPLVKVDGKPPSRLPINIPAAQLSWLELHRRSDGSIHYHLGAPTEPDLESTFEALLEAFPGAQLGSSTVCPLESAFTKGSYLFRAVPQGKNHYPPIQLVAEADRASLLLRLLSSRLLSDRELVLQVLFQHVPTWERGFFSKKYWEYAESVDRRHRPRIDARMAAPVYHVEMRAVIVGPHYELSERALQGWLSSWRAETGQTWWNFEPVSPRRVLRFREAIWDHDIDRFAGKRVRRDISGSELAYVLPIPWKEDHPEVSYAGAPASRIPGDLAGRPKERPDLVVGFSGDDYVRLPDEWNHLAILGRTRSGKSTLALNVVLQILKRRPDARVVILEPTGNLIHALLDRLPANVLQDTIQIDPAHPTTLEKDGREWSAVPLNLLQLPDRRSMCSTEFERRAERLAGDLLQAVKNAWGEESVGGRADYILRAVLQGLLSVPGTNLVDAYDVLSNKESLQRLERLTSGGPLRNALRAHLPKLDSSLTISSLDKVGKIATNPLLRKALCQRYGPVTFDQLLDHQLLLLNLGKGELGTEGANFLGAIFLTQLWSALHERRSKDVPVYLVVDEFHNYAIPAFADMLSEGAKLGLHVVAITQYLNRIPPKVRSAMVGNVDAWTMFALGAEDMKEAWSIVQGERFGWRPDHLVSGLGAHQAAFATGGRLLKIQTFEPFPPSGLVGAETVLSESSTRYVRLEDSEVSPLKVPADVYASFLQAFPPVAGKTRTNLASGLGWTPPEVDAAISLGKSVGDLVEDGGRELCLEVRGLRHREALAATRNEGEEHSSLLADIAVFLNGRGISVRIVPQEGGFLRPDAEFEWDGELCNIEVESSTISSHAEQVVRNVKKALAADRRCLVAVSDREAAERAALIIGAGIPSAKLWKEFGVVFRNGHGGLEPLSDGGRPPWSFQGDDGDGSVDWGCEEDEESEGSENIGNPPESATEVRVWEAGEGDVQLIRKLLHGLRADGKVVVTAADIVARVPVDQRDSMDVQRVGMALSSLDVPSRRVRRNGGQVREYDLSAFDHASSGSTIPAGRPDRLRRAPDDNLGSNGFAS